MKKKITRKRGQPTKFNNQIADLICEELENGRSLIDIAKQIALPYGTITRWLREEDKKDFYAKYARARENQAHYVAEKTLELAHEKPATYIDKNGATVIDPAWVANQKNKIDAHRWYSGKLNGKYSEKKDNDTTVNINMSLSQRLTKAIEQLEAPTIENED